jgi:hypothetical protein
VSVVCRPPAARPNGDQVWPGTLRDLSRLGLALVLERRFEPGTSLFIERPEVEGRPLLVRVVHATHLPQGTWLLGCAFPSRLSEEEIRKWLHPEEEPECSAAEQSQAEASARGAVIPSVTLVGPAGAGGKVVQRTVRWLKLPGAWPPPPGTILSVGNRGRVANPAGDRLRVLNCTTGDDGTWVLTYEFAGQPSPQVLRLLGYCREEKR